MIFVGLQGVFGIGLQVVLPHVTVFVVIFILRLAFWIFGALRCCFAVGKTCIGFYELLMHFY